nr:response regulator transcription factor [uncultured Flavobacterium sp.]
MNKIKLGLVDDDFLIVSLLKTFFSQNNKIQVVFDHVDGLALLEYLENSNHLPIDVLLLDLKMKTINGLEVLKEMKERSPETKVIVISSHYQDTTIGFMVKEGVSAFLPKGTSPLELSEIILQVYKNGFYFNDKQVQLLRSQISSKAPKPLIDIENSLTEREIEIVKLLCQQKTAKEIGEVLFITQRTVEGHKNNIFLKIGVKNIAGLIIFALQNQLVNLDELVVM